MSGVAPPEDRSCFMIISVGAFWAYSPSTESSVWMKTDLPFWPAP